MNKGRDKKMKIGFIGQGWIGRNYADDFEERGFKPVRYSQEREYVDNKEKIKDCDIVFIAVPTPSTPHGFDYSIVQGVMGNIGKGKIAVIKSTLLPGTTEAIQKEYPEIFIVHSPEFLAEATARFDASNPQRNIIGIPIDSEEYRKKAELVLSVLPKAPYNIVIPVREAELVKYGGNCFLSLKVIFANMLYDLAQNLDIDYDVVREAMSADPRIGPTHLNPIHKSGRGAGGHCFIKDFAAFSEIYNEKVGDEEGRKILETVKQKNINLLVGSNKDIDLLKGVYGEDVI